MPRSSRSSSAARSDVPRDRLLRVAVEVFGRHGFEGTSTRALAEAAGVNLQAIAYYFGGKEGLYRAAAGHVVAVVAGHVAGARERVRARLAEADAAGVPLEAGEARGLLAELLRAMAGFFVSAESEPLARFVLREQAAPSEAFPMMFDTMMKPLCEELSRLVGRLLGEPPDSRHVRLRTLSLLGGVMVFRVGRAAVLHLLGRDARGAEEAAAIGDLAEELARTVTPERGALS